MRAIAKGKFQRWLTPEGKTLLQGWARAGLSNEQIAHNMGISNQTFYVWMDKFPDISESIKKGKEIVDFEVENALLKRALGYTYIETKTEGFGEKDSDEPPKVYKVSRTTKAMPPDTAALIFWLKNRMPDRWRNRPTDAETDDDPLLKYLEGMRNA